MKQTICTIKGTFLGIYEWGPGWTSNEMAEKWNSFWTSNANTGTFWSLVRRSGCEYLLSLDGSVFLHPMGFTTTIYHIGENPNEAKLFKEYIAELNSLCTACAECCGGIFEMETSDETIIDTGELKPYSE